MNSNPNQHGVLREYMIFQKTHTQSLKDVRTLNMWGFDLHNVDIISDLENVETLSLSLNKISSLAPFSKCKRLQNLYLRQNTISNIQEVDHLSSLPMLTSLMLRDNPISAMPNYRSYIINKLPQLKKLDDIEILDSERECNDDMIFYSQPEPTIDFDIKKNNEKPCESETNRRKSLDDSFNKTNSLSSDPKNISPLRRNQTQMPRAIQRCSYDPSNERCFNMRSEISPEKCQYYETRRDRSIRGNYRRKMNDFSFEEEDEDYDIPFRKRSKYRNDFTRPRNHYSRKPMFNYTSRKKDSNMLSAVLSLIPELSDDSLQVVLEAIEEQRAY